MKKLTFALLATVLAIGMMGGAFAYFSDTAASNNNTFTAGTLGLEIADNSTRDPDPFPGSGPLQKTVDHTWEMLNMAPGDQVTNFAYLRETGTLDGDHIEVFFTYVVNAGADLGPWLEITDMLYNGGNLRASIMALAPASHWDVNANGWLDVDDLAHSSYINADGGPLDNLSTPRAVGGLGSLHMNIQFRADAPDAVQGSSLTMTGTLTLNQNSSQ